MPANHCQRRGLTMMRDRLVLIRDLLGAVYSQRPFRVHIDPANDGAEEVNKVGDQVRERFYERIGFSDLLHPAS